MMFRMGAVGWIIVLVLIVMILGMIDNMFFHPGGNQSASLPQTSPIAPAVAGASGGTTLPAGPVGPSVTPPSGPTAQALADAAAARAELSEATDLLTQAADSVNQTMETITVWETDIEPLRDNSDGRLIAAHADLAQQIAFLLQQSRPAKSDLTLAQERIKLLRDETDRLSAADPPGRLGKQRTLEIQNTHRQSGEVHSSWTQAVERARAIAREARRRQPPNLVVAPNNPAAEPVAPSAAPAAAAPTVPPAAVATSSPPAVAPAEPIVSPVAPPAATAQNSPQSPGRTLQETVVQIDDQSKIDALKEKMASEAKRKQAGELRLEQQRQLAERQAEEKAKLVAEARSDDVQRVLQPFLERRNIQPRLAGASLQWRQTVEQQPMSLSALENVGALAETVQGLSMLARVGSHRELSSPRWEFSPSSRTWSSDTQDRLKQAQDLLRRLGPTLAEEKLLAP